MPHVDALRGFLPVPIWGAQVGPRYTIFIVDPSDPQAFSLPVVFFPGQGPNKSYCGSEAAKHLDLERLQAYQAAGVAAPLILKVITTDGRELPIEIDPNEIEIRPEVTDRRDLFINDEIVLTEALLNDSFILPHRPWNTFSIRLTDREWATTGNDRCSPRGNSPALIP